MTSLGLAMIAILAIYYAYVALDKLARWLERKLDRDHTPRD